MKDKELEKLNMLNEPPTDSVQEVNTDFMKEEFKKRPVSRKKLLRSTLTTLFLAVLFGAVACAVFLLLEPVISRMIYPQAEDKVQVSFVEELPEEEMSPAEMIESDEQIAEAASQIKTDELKQEILGDLADVKAGIGDYSSQYKALAELAEKSSKSMVKAEGINSDLGWTGDSFESAGSTSGVIIAATDNELLILAQSKELTKAQKVRVTLSDQSAAIAKICSEDPLLGIVVLSVNKSDLSEETLKDAVPITLGSSKVRNHAGEPVLAIGMPAGTAGSMIFGMVISEASDIEMPDHTYHMIMTDIYAGTKASGILIDLNGKMIGLIDMSVRRSDMPNALSAVGITELRPIITAMSNKTSTSYLGIYGADVPDDIKAQMGIPDGMYVLRTELDSPAMDAGIQSGDVITEIGDLTIASYADYSKAMNEFVGNRMLTIKIKRRGAAGFEDISLHAVTDTRLITSED